MEKARAMAGLNLGMRDRPEDMILWITLQVKPDHLDSPMAFCSIPSDP
jgi:hypothetical protein